jgi:hypothetical protein
VSGLFFLLNSVLLRKIYRVTHPLSPQYFSEENTAELTGRDGALRQVESIVAGTFSGMVALISVERNTTKQIV